MFNFNPHGPWTSLPDTVYVCWELYRGAPWSVSQPAYTLEADTGLRHTPASEQWGRRDSNPHALLHMILSHARLPIPTLPPTKHWHERGLMSDHGEGQEPLSHDMHSFPVVSNNPIEVRSPRSDAGIPPPQRRVALRGPFAPRVRRRVPRVTVYHHCRLCPGVIPDSHSIAGQSCSPLPDSGARSPSRRACAAHAPTWVAWRSSPPLSPAWCCSCP